MTSDKTSLQGATRGGRARAGEFLAKGAVPPTLQGGVGSTPTVASPPVCPRCGGSRVYRMRKLPRGGQRWFCEDCQKSFEVYGGGGLALSETAMKIYEVLEHKKKWVPIYEVAQRVRLSEEKTKQEARNLWKYLRDHPEFQRNLVSRKASGVLELRLRRTK